MNPLYVFCLVYAGIFGVCLGSFMNVCIARMPEDRSVVHPRSACPRCGTPIAAYDNVPVLAWFWLGGRCRACKGEISALYPVIEALFGVLTVLLFRRVIPDVALLDGGHVAAFFWYLYLLFALVALSFIDLKHYIIPDPFSIYAVPVGVGGAALVTYLGYPDAPTWQQSVVGALIGGGLLLPIMGGYYLIRKEQGMGWGDPKLLALIGSYFGALPAMPVVILVGSVTGSIVGVLAALIGRKGLRLQVPFGPFLVAGALLWLFWGPMLETRIVPRLYGLD